MGFPKDIIWCNYDVLNVVDNSVFLSSSVPITFESSAVTPLSDIITPDMTDGALDEVLAILPVVIVVLIGFVAIRKGIGFIKSSVKSS